MNNIVQTYLKYLHNVSQDKNYVPSTDENTAIYNITHDVKYADLLNQINMTNDYEEKKKKIVGYLAEEEMKNSKDDKEIISKIYGIDVEDIESLKLNNDKEVFTFYDEKLGRKRIVENLGKSSLISQLKEIQNNSIDYQSDDYKKNSNDILENEAQKNNNRQEFKMIEIDEYINHPENYGTLDEDTREIINKLSNSKDSLEIKYINIENKVGLTKDNKVIEISKNKDGEFVFGEPIKWKQNVDVVDNESKVNENNNVEKNNDNQDDNSIDNNDFEDEPEFVSATEIEEEIKISNIEFSESVEEIKSNIKSYYNNPAAMDSIEDPMKKSFYEKMVNEIYAVRKANYLKQKEQTRSMVYTNPELNNNGFVNLIFVSILLLFLAFILFLGF